MHWWDGGWHMGAMWVWVVLPVAAVAALIWYLRRSGRERREGREESPEDILKRRYAKGEIDKEEYQRRLEDLRR